MDVSRPYSAVAPSLEGDVLAVLAGTTHPLTLRHVTRLVRHGSYGGVAKAIERLIAQGLVHRQVAGRAYLHTLNREHVAAPIVQELAELRTILLSRMREELRSWSPAPVHASMFGSAARGDGDAASDIDLFLVRPADVGADDPRWRAQVSRLGERVQAWTGNRLSPIEVSASELPGLNARDPAVLEQLREDHIDLAGELLPRVLDG